MTQGSGAESGAGAVHLDIPTWIPPYPASTPTFVRLSPTHLRERGCAEQVARKARPDTWPDARAPWEPAPVGDFPLGLVRDALLTLLTTPTEPQRSEGEPDVDPVSRAVDAAMAESWQDWSPDSRAAVRAGVIGYLDVLESLRAAGGLPDTLVFGNLVAVQDPDTVRVEMWAWALHHISVDGTLREAHLLRWRDASTTPLAEVEAALIAHVCGDGVIAEHDRWFRPFRPVTSIAQPPPAQRVRVRIVGLLDASEDVRFDGTPAEAAQRTQAEVPNHLGLLAGGSTKPSGGCAGCTVRHVCSEPTRMPGLLGVTGYAPRTRALSPSDLWTHRACPRRLHLARDLGLPRTRQEDGPALVRGTQVHAWLAAAHARNVPCTQADLPEEVDDGSIALDLGWTAEQYATNRPYLIHHLGRCPFEDPWARDLTHEIAVTVWDSDANVVFSTRPDTGWRAGDGRWVLRETKTLSPRGLPEDRTVLLDRYPQVAAAICLLADGFTPDGQPDQTPGVVQLELLGTDEGAVLEYDASDPIVVVVARTALADRVDAWLFDDIHPIGANPPCRSCEVFRWCEVSPISDEAAEGHPPVVTLAHDWAASDAVMAEIAGGDEDEEFPF